MNDFNLESSNEFSFESTVYKLTEKSNLKSYTLFLQGKESADVLLT